jgi:putative phage-type endonuclease
MLAVDCKQGSDEWKAARVGVVTASKFGEIITPTGKPTVGDKRAKYMNTLIAESLTGEPSETFQSEWMRRGTELEPEARDYYSLIRDAEVEQVGMVYLNEDRLIACSPDGLVDNGLWENKCPAPHTHVAYLLANKLPSQYKPQVQGQMYVTERDWCDFMSYHPDMKPLLVRVHRDEEYIKILANLLDKFVLEMVEKREQLRKAA